MSEPPNWMNSPKVREQLRGYAQQWRTTARAIRQIDREEVRGMTAEEHLRQFLNVMELVDSYERELTNECGLIDYQARVKRLYATAQK